MLAKPIPKGKIGKLAEAMLSRDFDTMAAHIQAAATALGKMVGEDAEVPAENKQAALHNAVVNYINKAEPNLDGQTALHLTANFRTDNDDDLSAQVLLLKTGANPNAQDANGNTLMHHYAAKCASEVSEFVKTAKDTQENRTKGANILEHYMTRICTLAYYKGDPSITNAQGQSPESIMRHTTPGLEGEARICYTRALQGATPPGKVEVNVPQSLSQANQPEGHHASRVSAERAANENQKKAACCVLL